MDNNERKAAYTLKEFMRYSSNPWRIVWVNFVAGIFRGLGAVIGASLVIALLVWVLSLFADMPLVGEYANEVKTSVMGYVEETNYNDEFNRLSETMERIEKELSEKNSASQK